MVNLYVCKICGEPYIGVKEPEDCPFCGAPKGYMRPAEEFSALWNAELTEQEEKAIKETLRLELNAASYYEKVSKTQEKYTKYNRLYKQLARVEKEHAEIASKFLKKEMPGLKGEDSKGSLQEDLKRTYELEKHAVQLYTEFLKKATNPNVKNLFTALIHAEKGHENFVEKEL